jgi:hypothetical protein
LLACAKIPLVWRVLWGFLAREGCRFHEALATLWSDIDRDHGAIKVPPERTKNGRGLHWVLAEGTLAGLDALFVTGVPRPFAAIDVDEDGAAAILRAHLRLAGVDRPEVHESTPRSRRLRCHDLRSTYITLALMAKKSEAEIMQHTGHRSSTQIHQYDHNARTAAEMKFTQLEPLDVALGLRVRRPSAPQGAAQCQAPQGVTEAVTLEGASRPMRTRSDRKSRMFSASSPSRIRTGKPLPARDFKGHRIQPEGDKAAESGSSPFRNVSEGASCHTPIVGGVTPSEWGVSTAQPIIGALADGLDERELTRLHELASTGKDWPLAAKLAQALEALGRAPKPGLHKVLSIADARKRRDESGGGK